MTETPSYLFTAWGDGTNTYIYRINKKGVILRANINEDHYHYIDLAEVPPRIIKEFKDGASRFWVDPVVISTKELSWNIQENEADTGLTDQEFIDLVIEKWPNTRFNSDTHKLETKIIMGDNTEKYVDIPKSSLKYFADRNKYYGNGYWMV